MSRPHVQGFFDEATFTVSYVVYDPVSRRAAIVDPVLDYDPASGRSSRDGAERLLDFVAERGLTVELLLETHVHADHLSAADHLRERTGAPLAIGEHIATVQQTFGRIFNAACSPTASASRWAGSTRARCTRPAIRPRAWRT